MRVIKLAAIWAALWLSTGVNAALAVVGLHLGTAHSQPGLCDANPGVYVVRADGITAGVYRNSECSLSAYAGKTWRTSGRLSFGLTAGLVTGYRDRPVFPLVIPSVSRAISDDLGVRLSYVPPSKPGGVYGYHLSLEYRL